MSGLFVGRYFYIFFFINFLITFAFGINDTLFPLYYKGYEVNGALLGMVFTMYSFSKIIMTPLTGKLLDKLGAFRILLFGLLLYLIVAILFLYVENKQIIILIRILQGIACAFFRPVMLYIVGNISSSSFRGKTIGIFDLSFYSALAIAPLIGGLLIKIYSFDLIFKLMIACCICALILALISKSRLQSIKIIRRTNLNNRPEKDNFILHFLYIYIFFRSWGITCTAVLLPLYLSDIGYSESHIGLLLSLSMIAMVCSLPFTGKLADNNRKDSLIFIGGAVTSICIIFLPHITGFYFLILILCIGGFFSAMSQPACSSLLIETAKKNELGVVIGRFNFAMSLGAAIGAFISSLLFSWLGVTVAFLWAGMLGFFASLIFVAVTEKYFSNVSYE